MPKVTKAKKAAEANLIARREETADVRSQANKVKLLQENPTLIACGSWKSWKRSP